MNSDVIYLDNAATTPLHPKVAQAMAQTLAVYGNPSSVHQVGQKARFLVEEARRAVAQSVNVRPEQVVFTSGGSEANALAIRGAAARGRVLCSAVEHPSVLQTVQAMGGGVLPVEAQSGLVQLEALEAELAKGDVGLVSIMWVNNETGIIQPIEKITQLCKKYQVLCHTDAVQAWGHLPTNFAAIGVDMMSLSAHKIGGPKGSGALVLRNEIQLDALLLGGGQERNRRAGTENLLGIVGMGAAAEACGDAERAPLKPLQNQLEIGLKNLGLNIEIIGENEERAPHITQFVTPDLVGADAVIALDLAGVAVSQGSACSSGRVELSHVLLAQGYGEKAASGLRISLGPQNTAFEVEKFLKAFQKVAGDLLS